MIQISLSSGTGIGLRTSAAKKFKGHRIPGSELYVTQRKDLTFNIHQYDHPLFQITLRDIHPDHAVDLINTEQHSWLRMEVVLNGGFHLRRGAEQGPQMLAGQYHITDQATHQQSFPSGQRCLYFTAHFSPELLNNSGSPEELTVSKPEPASQDILDLIYELLKNPFQGTLRDFYYANRVRDLLFYHAVRRPIALPGELSPQQIAQMYEADQIMAQNLDGHITIPELARMLGTNFVTLKRNYEKVFGIGIFPRLMQRKMEHIQMLLEKTDKPLKEIADLAGYQTLPAFINAFRKRYKVTPKEWRKQRRGLD